MILSLTDSVDPAEFGLKTGKNPGLPRSEDILIIPIPLV